MSGAKFLCVSELTEPPTPGVRYLVPMVRIGIPGSGWAGTGCLRWNRRTRIGSAMSWPSCQWSSSKPKKRPGSPDRTLGRPPISATIVDFATF